MVLVDLLDRDGNGEVTLGEWQLAFDVLDADGDGVITRKEWYRHNEDTALFDRIAKRSFAALARKEWDAHFRRLDIDASGRISMNEFHAVGLETLEEERAQVNYNLLRWKDPKTSEVHIRGPSRRDEAQDRLFHAQARKDVSALELAITEADELGIDCEHARDVLRSLYKKRQHLKEREELARGRIRARERLEQAVDSGDPDAIQAVLKAGRDLQVGKALIEAAERALHLSAGGEAPPSSMDCAAISIPRQSPLRYKILVPPSKLPHHMEVKDALQAAIDSGKPAEISRRIMEACGPNHPMYRRKDCKCHHCHIPGDILAQCWRHMEDCQRREHAQRRRWQHEEQRREVAELVAGWGAPAPRYGSPRLPGASARRQAAADAAGRRRDPAAADFHCLVTAASVEQVAEADADFDGDEFPAVVPGRHDDGGFLSYLASEQEASAAAAAAAARSLTPAARASLSAAPAGAPDLRGAGRLLRKAMTLLDGGESDGLSDGESDESGGVGPPEEACSPARRTSGSTSPGPPSAASSGGGSGAGGGAADAEA